VNLDLPPNPFMYEVLDLAVKQRSKAKKIEVLQKYSSDHVKVVLVWNFDESVISLLPPGDVPYGNLVEDGSSNGNLSQKIANRTKGDSIAYNGTEENLKAQKSSIANEYSKFYNFVKGGNPSLNSIKRELMFINILEGLHPREAEILALVKDKRLSERYKITKDIVSEAYPDISWGGRS
jgi:hypothetical protein|tara:strand:- start:2073 stop:2609 length:537 start_codon:yes stop_codon:yes gene_type:complete